MISLANLNTKGAAGGGGAGSRTALASSASQSAFDILEDHVRTELWPKDAFRLLSYPRGLRGTS
jgi:hypothetical protein